MGINSDFEMGYGVVVFKSLIPNEIQPFISELIGQYPYIGRYDGYSGACCIFFPSEEPTDLFGNVDRTPLVLDGCVDLEELGSTFPTGTIPEKLWEITHKNSLFEKWILLDQWPVTNQLNIIGQEIKQILKPPLLSLRNLSREVWIIF